MSTNWKPGMIAVCVIKVWYQRDGTTRPGPTCGDAFEVTKTRIVTAPNGMEVQMLFLRGWAADFSSTGFVPHEPLKEEMDRIESEGAPIEEPELVEA
jgi:hypothetical protein